MVMIHEGPYTNLHDLNIDWILQIVKEFFDKYSTIDEFIEAAENQLTTKQEELIAGMLATSVEALQAYNDNATEKMAELQSTFLGQLEELRTVGRAQISAISTAGSNAEQQVYDLIETLPSDFTDIINAIAPGYSQLTFPVTIGQLCWHDGDLFTANTNIQTSETWTAAHWTQTNISDAIVSAFMALFNRSLNLTDTQKAQGRENINAITYIDFDTENNNTGFTISY